MLLARARPLLGTLVSIHVQTDADRIARVARAVDEAFSTIAHLGCVMSAHQPRSDLGRIAAGRTGEVLVLDAHTVQVIRAAQYWTRVTGGAFNPCGAADVLSRRGLRPGMVDDNVGRLSDIAIRSETEVRLARSVNLDFGGIAKGYAVDCAVDVLRAHGICDALVNAGGDMRAIGQRKWPVDVRHAHQTVRDVRLSRLRYLGQQAIATSVAGPLNPELVMSQTYKRPPWRSATIQADTCMAADVLTKWALQSSLLCPGLHHVLRLNRARMWRTR